MEKMAFLKSSEAVGFAFCDEIQLSSLFQYMGQPTASLEFKKHF